jgi:hypothetical protein
MQYNIRQRRGKAVVASSGKESPDPQRMGITALRKETPKMQRNRYFLASCLLIVLGIYALLPEQLLAESGIRWPNEITMVTPDNPPPDQTRVSTFSLAVENVNDVCNEDVKISVPAMGLKNDPFKAGLKEKGAAQFLGFKETKNGSLLQSISFNLEDESCEGCARPPKTIYFDVETGEDANGCDFQAFSLKVKVCDTGEHCFFCCDNYDGDVPCETPTALVKVKEVQAGLAFQPSGSGTINGKVSDSSGRGLNAKIKISKVGTCVPGQLDVADSYDANLSTKRNGPNKGIYSAASLPFGNYKVVAKRDGVRQEKSVSVVNSTPVVVDFQF